MLTIYGSNISSPSNKVQYVANYLDITYQFHNVNLRNKEQHSEEFLKINPYGRIPAIDDAGFHLAESGAIIRYLANKQESSLYPQAVKERAIIDQWLDFVTLHIAIPMSKIMFNTYFHKLNKIDKDARSLLDGQAFLARNLPKIEEQLHTHTHLTGKEISLADIALIAALDPAEVADIDLTQYPKLDKWRKILMQEAFYVNCHNSYSESFNPVLKVIENLAERK